MSDVARILKEARDHHVGGQLRIGRNGEFLILVPDGGRIVVDPCPLLDRPLQLRGVRQLAPLWSRVLRADLQREELRDWQVDASTPR